MSLNYTRNVCAVFLAVAGLQITMATVATAMLASAILITEGLAYPSRHARLATKQSGYN